ncbi:MAG: monofunctional biosynthetic peptidoglycan transglycosylase [Hyphomicrobiaceae bacterium]
MSGSLNGFKHDLDADWPGGQTQAGVRVTAALSCLVGQLTAALPQKMPRAIIPSGVLLARQAARGAVAAAMKPRQDQPSPAAPGLLPLLVPVVPAAAAIDVASIAFTGKADNESSRQPAQPSHQLKLDTPAPLNEEDKAPPAQEPPPASLQAIEPLEPQGEAKTQDPPYETQIQQEELPREASTHDSSWKSELPSSAQPSSLPAPHDTFSRIEPALPRQSFQDAPIERPVSEAAFADAQEEVAASSSVSEGRGFPHAAGAYSHAWYPDSTILQPTETRDIQVAQAKPWRRYLRTGLRYAAVAFAVWYAAMFLLIVLFRFVDPPGTPLMAWRVMEGEKLSHQWVPLTKISRNLQKAVVVSEDGRFCQHWGIDPAEVLAAIRRARNGTPRGASTITMQVAKNLFLWPSKSYLRKALEAPLAVTVDLVWPKRRILEVYLNIAEWGPGVFGAQAAARYHFKTSARSLGQRQAALLAVSLPNPISRNAGKPGRGTSRLARIIQARAAIFGGLGCIPSSS